MMNRFKYRITGMVVLLAALFFITGCSSSHTAQTESSAVSDANFNQNNWKFYPRSALPQNGIAKMVDASFFVSLMGDSLSVYLPYYGTNYGSSDIMSGKNPLDFNTNKIVLNKSRGKNNLWEIQVQPKGQDQVDLMDFKFYTNGTASLYIRFTSRSSISYNGTVQGISSTK